MDNMEALGWAVSIIITLGAFISVIMKFTKPINDLRLVVQKLMDMLENQKESDKIRDKRIDEHETKIGTLENKVGTLETKVHMYHGK